MPYAVSLDEFFDLTGTPSVPGVITWSAVVGGIWVPPPSDGTSPGPPTFSGTVTIVSGQSRTLIFPALAGPPTTASAMLVSQPSAGDLYRLGAAPPPANPANLNGETQAAPVLSQTDLNNLTAGIGPQTLPVPDWLGNLFTIATAGLYVPQSMTVTGVALALPQAPATGILTLTLTGTVAVSGWFGTSDHPFTFTETVALAPSGDPVDAARILAATQSSASITISGGWVLTLFGILANVIAGDVTPILEGQFNQGIASKVADALAGLTPPQMLSPQAVISANTVVITSSGLALTLSVADIFGPATIPLQLMAVNATLVGKDQRRRTIRVDVTDAATGAPLAGALVRIFGNVTGGQTASGNTDQNGSVTLSYPACSETSNGPPIRETSCTGTVSQQGFKDQDFDTPAPLP